MKYPARTRNAGPGGAFKSMSGARDKPTKATAKGGRSAASGKGQPSRSRSAKVGLDMAKE